MYLPELNHISNYRYELNGFGGINRRETADIGEFTDAVNLSSEEYPLIMPRKRYDVGIFPKTALMWHNNDRDMALVPAIKSEEWTEVKSQSELALCMPILSNGIHYVYYTGEVTGSISYLPTESDETTVQVCEINPCKAYRIEKTGYIDGYGCITGIVTEVTDKSRISYATRDIELPTDIVVFKNPVCANIGTSTVICDEINGMWVLEYDKDSDTYSYNKVHSKYTVKNEYNKVSGLDYISGGSFCHMRIMFENGIPPETYGISITNDAFATHEEWLAHYVTQEGHYNHLVYCGAASGDGIWVQVLKDGAYQIVDNLIYRFCLPNADKYFKVGDYINISGLKAYYVDPKSDNAISDNTVLKELEGYHEIINIEYTDDYGWGVDIKHKPLSKAFALTMFVKKRQLCKPKEDNEGVYEIVDLKNDVYLVDGMTIERKAPENVRFICSHMNRIWANNGNNEIMCCARGNPYVWYRYEGNALDSWAATIGGDGAFTGCINYGYPLFFKDNRMFRVTGTHPSNFGYDEYSIKGIRNGCHDSTVIVNDVLYYQSIDGIYAYNSSTPVCVSEKVYKNWQRGKACRFRDKYYIAVTEDGESRLYCYDTRSGAWHREDMGGADIRYLYPGRYLDGYEEYMTVYTDLDDENHNGYVISTQDEYINGKEDPVEWMLETTDLLASEPETKYLKGIYINCRIFPEEENEIEFSVQYDGDGEWLQLASVGPQKGCSRSVWYNYPMAGKRCDNLKIKAEGIGKAVIYGIILEFEKGSTKR
ncbi:MAG: hypothetical protein IJB57_02540 [Clostridia bacterium]|nr:hypothetical protein [Clostridia bacterium]